MAIGKPKYKVGDRVHFKEIKYIDAGEVKDFVREGTVCIVDAYGTCEYPDVVCYDVMTDSEILIKHIREDDLL